MSFCFPDTPTTKRFTSRLLEVFEADGSDKAGDRPFTTATYVPVKFSSDRELAIKARELPGLRVSLPARSVNIRKSSIDLPAAVNSPHLSFLSVGS